MGAETIAMDIITRMKGLCHTFSPIARSWCCLANSIFFYRFLNNFSVWKLWFFLSGTKSKDKKKKGKNAKSNLPKDDGEEMPLPPASLQVPLICF